MNYYLLVLSLSFATPLCASAAHMPPPFIIHIHTAPEITHVLLEIHDATGRLLEIRISPEPKSNNLSYHHAQLLINQKGKTQEGGHDIFYDVIVSPVRIIQITCTTSESTKYHCLRPTLRTKKQETHRSQTRTTIFEEEKLFATQEMIIRLSHEACQFTRITQV